MSSPSKPVPPGTPPPSPPPSGPRHPAPSGPGPGRYTDNLFDLAASLGFQDLGHAPQGVRPAVAADSEGRTGGTAMAPGAVPFTLPPAKTMPSFDGPQAGGPPPRPKPTGPVPHPPPPFVPGEFPPPVIGEGQLYDVDPALWRALSVECQTWPSVPGRP